MHQTSFRVSFAPTVRALLVLAAAAFATGSTAACSAPSLTRAPITGGTIVGSRADDAWLVQASTTALTIQHFDGGAWQAITAPASVATPRGTFSTISAGDHAIWIGMAPSAPNGQFALVHLTSTGAVEDHGAELPAGTGPDDVIRLFGRAGAAVVQIVPTTGTALVFRYDGSHFVAVPALPSPIAEVVAAPGGNDIWARGASPMGMEDHWRFDGSSWQPIAGTTVTTTLPWTANASDNVWAPTGTGPAPSLHWDGSAFTTVTPPRESDLTTSTANVRNGSVVLGTVATTSGRGVELLMSTQQDAQMITHADLLYRTATSSTVGDRRTLRSSLEHDADSGRGFHSPPGTVTVLDDGTAVVQITARTGTSDHPDTGETGLVYFAAPGSLQ